MAEYLGHYLPNGKLNKRRQIHGIRLMQDADGKGKTVLGKGWP